MDENHRMGFVDLVEILMEIQGVCRTLDINDQIIEWGSILM